jgi:putative ABC transport system substrate-binding protein
MNRSVARRKFIAIVGAASVWPLAAHTQSSRIPRIGVLLSGTQDNADLQARLDGLRQGLNRLGWKEGSNIRIDYRFGAGDSARYQALAKELIALQPDVIVAQSPPVVAAVQRETRTIPIVLVDVSDPIGAGFIETLARPGGNITGPQNYEASVVGKWLAMLKEIAPSLTRAAMLINPKTSAFDYYWRAASAAAPKLDIELVPLQVGSAADIEHEIESFAGAPNGGLMLPPDATTILHSRLIIALAVKYRLPAIYPFRFFVVSGGLLSYSIDAVFEYRLAASYVDRILHGENPADIPVQAPTKFETVLNLKTAKALGFTVPPGLLVAADEVIE